MSRQSSVGSKQSCGRGLDRSQAMNPRGRRWVRFLLVVAGVSWSPAVSQVVSHDDALTSLRVMLEEPFLETGGFATFQCALPPEGSPPRSFDCTAQSRDGKIYDFLLVPEEDGMRVEMVTEPAHQVAYQWMDALEVPCRRMVDQYNRAAWEEMHADFHPSLQSVLPIGGVEAILAPQLAQMGKGTEVVLDSYSKRDGERHELLYTVRSEQHPAAFRCGVILDDQGAQLVALLVMPKPGTTLYEQLFEREGGKMLSITLGQKVSELEIPFDRLQQQHDVVESKARLENGQEFAVLIERTGRSDDFETVDFSFKVLDVPVLLTTYYRTQGLEPESIECPTRVVPDGGRLDCNVQLVDGESLEITVERRGGDHRLLPRKPGEE